MNESLKRSFIAWTGYIKYLQKAVNKLQHPEGIVCIVCGSPEINTYLGESALCAYHDTPPDGI